MENNTYCKLYVSDWTINIEGQNFLLNQMKDETIKYYADQSVEIILTSATIDIDFFNKIKENMNIGTVIQKYEMRNISDGEDYKFENIFYNMKFQSINVVHINVNQDCAIVNIILSNG